MVEKIYQPKENKKNFDEVVKELKETFETKAYKSELIRRTLKENEKLRKTYVGVMILNPAKLSEIKEKVMVTGRTLYGYLYKLINLGLLKKIPVMDLWNRRKLEGDEKVVIKKFKDWTSKMSNGQLQFFAGKTNYFVLTKLGKDETIINWVLKLEKEQKVTEEGVEE